MIEPLLVLVVIGASAFGLIYLWYRVFKQRSGSGLSTCGHCGYAVRGLESMTCPECGEDLREVGIVTPGRKNKVSPILFVISWTLLLPGPACLITAPIVALVPHQQQYVSSSETFLPHVSGEYSSVVLSANGQIPFQEVEVIFVGNHGVTDSIEVDTVNLEYQLTGSKRSTWKTFDSNAVLVCLNGIGADTTKQHVQDEALELFAVIQAWQGINGPSTSSLTRRLYSTGGTSSSMASPPPVIGLLMVLVWICIWIGGFFLFFRINPWILVQAIARMFG